MHATKHVSNRVPRFALPSELTQPSFVLASFSGKDEPARPIAAQEAAQQAMAQAGNAAATVAAAPQAAAGPSVQARRAPPTRCPLVPMPTGKLII